MPVYKPDPYFQIATASATWTNDQVISGQIRRIENGFDTANLFINNYQSKNYIDNIDADGAITVGFKNASDASYTTVLRGIVRMINPTKSNTGSILQAKCDGAGYGVAETACAQEYGTQSVNYTLDKIQEIITDANNGIYPKWIAKILGTATDSGHSYTCTTTEIEDIAGSITYIYFPYKPNNRAFNDLIDLLQAIKGSNAGAHWIVTTDSTPKILLTTVGNHHAGATNAGWTTYYGGSQSAATLVENIDFKEHKFEKLAKEANAVLYESAFRYPASGDNWTEGAASSWAAAGGVGADFAISDDVVFFQYGSKSLEFKTGSGVGGNWVSGSYPSAKTAGWDITKWGGKYSIPKFHLSAYRFAANVSTTLEIYFYTDAANYYYYQYAGAFATIGKWYQIEFPIGPYSYQKTVGDEIRLEVFGNPSWANINWFEIKVQSTDNNNAYGYIDGVRFTGTLVRLARETTIDSTNKLRFKVITDDAAKDDSMIASDDSGTIARMAYAELLRGKSTPIVGTIKTPLLKDLLPGQLLHIHAEKEVDGTFRIDKDMRVTELVHSFNMPDGYSTVMALTDDVTNSRTRPSYTDFNKVMSAIRPEYQDRQSSSIKAREIDITQAVLSKSY